MPRPTSAWPTATAGFKHAPPDGAGASSSSRRRSGSTPADPDDDQGAPRRDPPLAPGAPAARPAVGRQRLPQPAPATRPAGSSTRRAQGHADRRRRRLREARQLHRQRPEGDRRRRAPPGRPRPRRGPRPRTASSSRSRSSSSATGRAGEVGARDRPRPAAGRRPARRAVGRARRVDRVRDGHRRGPRRRAATTVEPGPHRPRRRAGGGCPPDHRRDDRPGAAYDDPAALGADGPACRRRGARPPGRRATRRRWSFIALHGPFGEDGTVQALLEAAGLAYTGSGRRGLGAGMDKALFKRLCRGLGLPVVDWREVRADALGGRSAPAVRGRARRPSPPAPPTRG